ncbi:MAG: hypothetical protein IPM25_18515 [Chloracidobacterium sp.]|nr:hypothetical protein [Chloracidobacterium sp.]
MPLCRVFLFAAFLTTVLSPPVFSQSWKVHSTGHRGDLIAIHFTSSSKGFIAGDDGYLASTVDAGRTWQSYPLKTTENINEIYFRNEDNGYLVAGRKLFITSDGGNSWMETRIGTPAMFGRGIPEYLSIRFADKKRGLAVGALLDEKGEYVLESLVMRTDDGGETWSRIAVPTKVELFHLDFDGNSRAWIVGDKGTVLATTDGGLNWRLQETGADRALFNVDFRDDELGFAVGGGGTILRTEDGGRNWVKVETPFTETLKRVDFADDKNGWVVGHKGTILRSADKGRTWVRQDCGTDDDLYGLYIVKRYGWAVGANGTLVEYLR